MKIQTKDLDGIALKWAALTCDGWTDLRWKDWIGATSGGRLVMTSTSIERHADFDDLELDVLGIIEREGINIFKHNGEDRWGAHKVVPRRLEDGFEYSVALTLDGPTPSVAVLRLYVATKLSYEVEVPDILFGEN